MKECLQNVFRKLRLPELKRIHVRQIYLTNFTFTNENVDWVKRHDMVLHAILKQPALSSTATNVSDEPAMRWCAFPGERLCKKTAFAVNGNPLDEYTVDAYNFHREYSVQPNKMTGWYRCMGQELPHKGFCDQPNWVNSGVEPSVNDHRFATEVYTGHQTPTGQKAQDDTDNVELFIPLLFWFNKDPRLAVPSVSIPYGQRFINIDLATQQELVGLVPRGAGDWATPLGSLSTATNLISTMELYINNILKLQKVNVILLSNN